jgi:hypothetical protein
MREGNGSLFFGFMERSEVIWVEGTNVPRILRGWPSFRQVPNLGANYFFREVPRQFRPSFSPVFLPQQCTRSSSPRKITRSYIYSKIFFFWKIIEMRKYIIYHKVTAALLPKRDFPPGINQLISLSLFFAKSAFLFVEWYTVQVPNF